MGLWLAQVAQREVTTTRLAFLPDPWKVFLIAALVAAFAAAAYLLEPKVERNRFKGPLALLRGLILALVVVVLFRPLETHELQEVRNGLVLVAVDTSRSMGFLDRERDEGLRRDVAKALDVTPERLRELDRLSRVKLALRADEGAFLRRLAEKNRVRIYGFDEGRKRLADVDKLADAGGGGEDDPVRTREVTKALGQVEAAEADGRATALGDALQRILTDVRSERVAGVVLLTDGRSTGGAVGADAVAARFGRKGVPVFAVGVGDPEPPRDLAVDDLRAPDVTLAGDVMRGSVVVRAQGYTEPREVRLKVKLDDLQVAEEVGRVGGDVPEWEVQFSTKIVRPGEYTLEASVEPDPDELTAENNKAIRRVRVIDERIRVLFVEGYPRWEYRYLKNALIRDRHMQVQCFLVQADEQWEQEHSEGVPALTRLPAPEQLLDYHVVILGDVNPEARDRTGAPVFPEGALEKIRELVKDRGGGLLMIAGEQNNPRSYAGTPLAEVLPVQIDPSAPRDLDFSRPYRPRLSREGQESELLRLELSDAESKKLWEATLPDLYWYMRVERAKPQAHVLAVHPRDKNSHGAYPLLAWHRYGAGTSFWIGFDEAWRWRAPVGDKYHYRFYGQIIRFLSLQSFTRAKRFFVTTDKTHYDVGEEVRVRAEIRDRDAVANRAQQEVAIDLPDGKSERLVLKALEGEEGKFEGVYKPVQLGAYRLSIDPGQFGSESEVASRVFEVRLPRLELQDPRMDEEGLQRLAQLSNGRFIRLHQLGEIPDQLGSLSEEFAIGREERELWDRPWVFALFLALLLLEWIGRKVARLM